jgi:endonuclease-3
VTGGTYTLLAALPDPATVAVGALGRVALDAGWYAYTGSALGPGGFSRVARHREIAAGTRDARHWHVDYLLGDTPATVERVFRAEGADVECEVAETVADAADGVVDGFGCSDCGCDSHLAYAAEWATVERALARVYRDDYPTG